MSTIKIERRTPYKRRVSQNVTITPSKSRRMMAVSTLRGMGGMGGNNPRFQPARQQEIKSFDSADVDRSMVLIGAVTGSDANYATGFSCINIIGAGTAYYQHIGSKVTTKSIRLSMGLYSPIAAVGDSARVRYMIIYDRQPTGAYPTTPEILLDSAGGTEFNTGINMTNRSRFLMLRDKIVTLDMGGGNVKHIDEYVKTRLETEYKGDPTGISDITTGALYLIFFYDNTSHANVPTFQDMSCRIRYYD